MKTRFLSCLTVGAALLAAAPLWADTPPPAPARPLTLDQALAAMPDTSVNDGSVVLTVMPEYVPPAPVPTDGAPTDDSGVPAAATVPTPQSLAARYGRTLQVFGPVLALASPTMTVLATDPALADVPISELAVQHPLPFLLGTLTPAQMAKMSGAGLGLADLSPDQQALLKAGLPAPFQIVPKSFKPPSYTMDEVSKTGPERAEIDARIAEDSRLYTLNTQAIPPEKVLSSARLYVYLSASFTFDDAGIGVGYSDNPPATTGTDVLVNGGRMDFGTARTQGNPLQLLLKSELPNTPKPSDLDWDRSALHRPVSLRGIKTVDDLAARLAKATGLELYADARYGKRSALVRGDLAKPQESGQVMQALALCVCGAWRRVGPAFVLTDDVAGIGARQEFLHEIVQAWSNRLTEAGKSVGGHLAEADWLHAVQFAPGDIGALSAAQVGEIQKENGTNSGHLRWRTLSPALQAGLRGQLLRHYDGDSMGGFEAAAKGAAKKLSPEASVDVTLDLRVGIGLPGTGVMTLGDPYRVQMPTPASAAVTGPPRALANSVTLDKPLRGVLCAPRTPDEARAVVAKAAKMGLNTLFLDVFTGGRAYFPNTALPPADSKAGGVLSAALDAAKTSHLAVYAVADLLCWRKDGAAAHPQPWPQGFSEDLTITGEAPDKMVRREFDQHTVRMDFDRDLEMGAHGSQSWVSPLDPRVTAVLPPLLHDLAGVKGLAGIVLQDTGTFGYLGVDYDFDEENIALGYTLENRLAFLRTHHTDPIDLSTTNENPQLFLPFEGTQTSFDATIPMFRTGGSGSAAAWNTLRSDADKTLLARCYAAVRSAAPAVLLLVRERCMGLTLDPWTDSKTLNQIVSLDTLDHPFQKINGASILCISYGPVEKAHPDQFAWETAGGGPTGEDGKRAGGELFDLVTGGLPKDLPDTLDKLNVFLKKP